MSWETHLPSGKLFLRNAATAFRLGLLYRIFLLFLSFFRQGEARTEAPLHGVSRRAFVSDVLDPCHASRCVAEHAVKQELFFFAIPVFLFWFFLVFFLTAVGCSAS